MEEVNGEYYPEDYGKDKKRALVKELLLNKVKINTVFTPFLPAFGSDSALNLL